MLRGTSIACIYDIMARHIASCVYGYSAIFQRRVAAPRDTRYPCVTNASRQLWLDDLSLSEIVVLYPFLSYIAHVLSVACQYDQ